MKRSGFTMIELVFVIVILGILASVAIPKLAATRDDAKVAKAASEVSTLIGDLSSYYTSQGKFGNLEQMTNVRLTKTADVAKTNDTITNAELITGAYYTDTSAKTSCLKIVLTGTDGNMTISSESNATAFCKGLNGAVASLLKTHQFGGSSISFE